MKKLLTLLTIFLTLFLANPVFAAPTQSASLSGTTMWFSRAYNSTLNFSGSSFSACIWTNVTTQPTASAQYGLMNMYDNSGQKAWYFVYEDLTGTPTLQMGGTFGAGGTFARVSGTLATGSWHQTCMTYNSVNGNTKFYIDGAQQGATQTANTGGTATLTTQPFQIGGDAHATWTTFAGKLSQAEVFNTELSAATISSYYCYTFLGSEPNLVGSWSLSNTLADLTANAFTLTNNGSIPFTADVPTCLNKSSGLLGWFGW